MFAVIHVVRPAQLRRKSGNHFGRPEVEQPRLVQEGFLVSFQSGEHPLSCWSLHLVGAETIRAVPLYHFFRATWSGRVVVVRLSLSSFLVGHQNRTLGVNAFTFGVTRDVGLVLVMKSC